MSGMRPRLSEIVDALDSVSDEMSAYLDRETGEVVVVTDDDIAAAEREAALVPEWQREAVAVARLVLADEEGGGGRFVPLPDRFDLGDGGALRAFARSMGDAGSRERLEGALGGRGSFRRFKDVAAELGLLERWYAYQAEARRRVAEGWCRENGVEWAEG